MKNSKLNQKAINSVPFFSLRICNFQWWIQIFQTPNGRWTPIYYSANISKKKKKNENEENWAGRLGAGGGEGGAPSQICLRRSATKACNRVGAPLTFEVDGPLENPGFHH